MMTDLAEYELELDHLLSRFPLSPRWRRPQRFSGLAEIDRFVIRTEGLLAESNDASQVTGSAGAADDCPLPRAYFELIERATLLDWKAQPRSRYALLDDSARAIGDCEHADVFLEDSPQADFRHSISNGVAIHSDPVAACAAARAELVERDRLLRSWFGGARPERLPAGAVTSAEALAAAYDFESYEFPAGDRNATNQLRVAGVFGFPKRDHAPLVFGTAAATALPEAVARAERECLQRLGFLWGEAIPVQLPAFEASAAYHQDYYLCPHSHRSLRLWLSGEYADETSALFEVPSTRALRFANLTPEHLSGRLWVVKALPDTELPLVFGRIHPNVDPSRQRHGVHPLA
jgi:hypothetical protein